MIRLAYPVRRTDYLEGRPDPAKLTAELKESGLNAHYLVAPDSAHEWKTWRLALLEFSQLLFK